MCEILKKIYKIKHEKYKISTRIIQHFEGKVQDYNARKNTRSIPKVQDPKNEVFPTSDRIG